MRHHKTLVGVMSTACLGLSILAGPAVSQAPIPSLPWVIDTPGSYVLVSDLMGDEGITINASHVTLDLGGFVLDGSPQSEGDGIVVRGKRVDLEVFNGVITGWPGRGIMADTATNSLFHDLRLAGNGLCGLRAGSGAVVENVVSEHNNGSGIVAFDAAMIVHSIGHENLGFGVEVGEAGVVQGLSVFENGAGGIFAGDGALITDNAVKGNGWLLSDGGVYEEGGAPCFVSTGAGITVFGTGARVVDNLLVGNWIGLQLMMGGNAVSGNQVRSSVLDNFDFAMGNQLELLLVELPETISWPAVVTLAGTLSGVPGEPGIVLASDDITVDLGGHCIFGVPGSTDGIVMDGRHMNVLVRNGIVRFWDGDGIQMLDATNSRVMDVRVFHNGGSGILLGEGGTVFASVVLDNDVDGLFTDEDALVEDVTSNNNGGRGIRVGPHSQITGSVASENGGFGIEAAAGTTVRDCTSSRNLQGIRAEAGCFVEGCAASFNIEAGIRVGARSYVLGNEVVGDPTLQVAIGIWTLEGPGIRIDGNSVSGANVGMSVQGEGNIVIRNSLTGNNTPYLIAPANAWGEFLDVSAGGVIGTSDPWCNFVMTP